MFGRRIVLLIIGAVGVAAVAGALIERWASARSSIGTSDPKPAGLVVNETGHPGSGGGRLPPLGETSDQFAHDLGRKVAGEPATHTFRVHNPSDEPLDVLRPEDVRPNCGCSALVPAASRIPPRGQVDVTVRIDTLGKSGWLSHGGTITWTAPTGRRRDTSFRLSVDVLSPLTVSPERLTFSTREIREGVTKEVVVEQHVPIDWATFYAHGSSPEIQVVRTEVGGDRARCRVKCVYNGDHEFFDGHVVVRAGIARDAGVPAAGQTAFAQAAVRAESELALNVVPNPVSLRLIDGAGTASLMVRGKRIASLTGRRVKSADCPGYSVTWEEKGAAGTSLILWVRFERKSAAGAKPVLRIELADGAVLRVPVVDG